MNLILRVYSSALRIWLLEVSEALCNGGLLVHIRSLENLSNHISHQTAPIFSKAFSEVFVQIGFKNARTSLHDTAFSCEDLTLFVIMKNANIHNHSYLAWYMQEMSYNPHSYTFWNVFYIEGLDGVMQLPSQFTLS